MEKCSKFWNIYCNKKQHKNMLCARTKAYEPVHEVLVHIKNISEVLVDFGLSLHLHSNKFVWM